MARVGYWIGAAMRREFLEQFQRDQHRHGRTQGHEHMRSDPDRNASEFSVKPQQEAECRRDPEPPQKLGKRDDGLAKQGLHINAPRNPAQIRPVLR